MKRNIVAVSLALAMGAYPLAPAFAAEALSASDELAIGGFATSTQSQTQSAATTDAFSGVNDRLTAAETSRETQGIESTEGIEGVTANAPEDVALLEEFRGQLINDFSQEPSEAEVLVEEEAPAPEATATSGDFAEPVTSDPTVSNFSESANGPLLPITSLAGDTQYDTAATEAMYAFSKSDYVIVASGISAVDALSATSLAGALNCPIVLTERDTLPGATASAIGQLGATHVLIIGGSAVISENVASQIANITGATPERLWGEDLFDTQIAIYQYGAQRHLWGATVFVANGELGVADALSISPAAYAMHAPVFLAASDGLLPEKTVRVLMQATGFIQGFAIGGPAVIKEETLGIIDAVAARGGGSYPCADRIWGESLYDTSAAVAQWAVSNHILSMDGAAFATGRVPYDALAGSAVQGTARSVLLLIDEGSYAAIDAARAAGGVSHVKFFGGNAVVTPRTRVAITNALGIEYISVQNYYVGISLSSFAQIELANYMKTYSQTSYTADSFAAAIDPNSYSLGSEEYYQFLDLGQSYYGITAEQIDAYIASHCTWSEQSFGVTSNLRGTGKYFIEAAEAYDINVVYLLSHAIIESGWGCSALSQGTISGFEGYYNFFGIGAYDSNPGPAGAKMAYNHNWNSAEAAIWGGAEWVSNNYFHPTVASGTVSGEQRTLWAMRWDVRRAATTGDCWHQYATDVEWAANIGHVMGNILIGCGCDVDNTGLTYLVPTFG